MATYTAHYRSPNGDTPVSGVFDFESAHRAGSKGNMHDARLKMLESYGNEAVAWIIDEVKTKKANAKDAQLDHQMQLDFREEPEHKVRKRVKRGF
ncbi:hypothetical protein [Slackia heliotrinireducens]|uniref:Uncharacterized protein n=1 Tax=Slackia heliotrinireducens (strain ATCC 29202 / DSM 20476 / NCTC 11029 / RHS 1) TaxID=471855 RepID=C7N0L9_SLAHD|nr:hypothetical protein [Slackia heliotrinireducens]ACV21097.1 hypothetical protein Shel_00210 [Slackia heliotrinireducens DSM 20476]VEH03590.1 Uncharacterised protein [Slackia heliotrinireducens]